MLMKQLDLANSLMGTFLAQGRGIMAIPATRQPEKTLELYDRENNAECRRVRETLTRLDLDVMIYPCPQDGTRFSRRLKDSQKDASSFAPLLADPNNNETCRGAQAIIDHLYAHYGHGHKPSVLETPLLSTPASVAVSALRLHKGDKSLASRAPEQRNRKVLIERAGKVSVPYLVDPNSNVEMAAMEKHSPR